MCNCTGQLARGRAAPGPTPVLGERGLLLVEASGPDLTPHKGPVTGTIYPFDERPRMYVDRRDVVYFLGPSLRLAA